MKSGWRLVTIEYDSAVYLNISQPSNHVGEVYIQEVTTPHIGHHPMHDNYIGLNPRLQIIVICYL
ncbi:MAG: hypothetical protein K2M34_03310, partial [Alphaproteobacteria bacterium]|nr:hypothetical protein [Alphaproteobacteria bacterium]